MRGGEEEKEGGEGRGGDGGGEKEGNVWVRGMCRGEDGLLYKINVISV